MSELIEGMKKTVCRFTGHDPRRWTHSQKLPGARTRKFKVCDRCGESVEEEIVQHDAQDVDLPKPPGYYDA